ncbi:hypothetical protein [Parasedimentitalea psychrophila]|uniref:Lipoprotein n=1 Tax=Parasedimentitalea psychrophila TaxID=2997337 RepID=A0A9Y2P5N5_9RHOB|nr:hypothetical protein [Parasedimentitalea psychrophila]WIY26549.1 hypothetical protein QPJ95_06420 [Parasedimentitalea psychrophila]
MKIQERQILRSAFLLALLFATGCAGALFILRTDGAMVACIGAIMMSAIIGFIWLAAEVTNALRRIGLGEGTAQLYGQAHAKRIFGDDFERDRKND